MKEMEKLIEYAELLGHYMWVDGDNVMVKNGKKLSHQLERLIVIHKEDILTYLKGMIDC